VIAFGCWILGKESLFVGLTLSNPSRQRKCNETMSVVAVIYSNIIAQGFETTSHAKKVT